MPPATALTCRLSEFTRCCFVAATEAIIAVNCSPCCFGGVWSATGNCIHVQVYMLSEIADSGLYLEVNRVVS